jgi:hypothetical protein
MRPRPVLTAALAAAALAAAGCGSGSSTSTSTTAASSAVTSTTQATSTAAATSSGPEIGFEGVPIEQGPDLASPGTTGTAAVDGIKCGPTEQIAYHIHAHLAVFDDGRLYALPGGVGIPGSQVQQSSEGPVAAGGQCYYWLHTHAPDGVVHIESPTKRIYSLGDFFDIWRQPLTGDRVASLKGKITAVVNGKTWTKSPRAIPLLPHEDIQLEIGEPPPPLVTIHWPSGL